MSARAFSVCGGAALFLALAALLLAPRAAHGAQAAPGPGPAPVEASASVDAAVATTGDLITYSIVVEHDPAFEIEMAEPGAEIAGFRIVDLGADEPRRDKGRIVERRWYQLRADLVGSYVLPPVTVRYRAQPAAGSDTGGSQTGATGDSDEYSTLTTSEIFVEVRSVLPAEGEATDIRDIKPLQPLPGRVPWGWIAAGAVALLLVGAGAGYWLWRRRQPKVSAPALPPHELAFRRLDALRATDFTDPEAVRRFHFDLSDVLRAYVEGRFGLNATDLTTEEILPQLGALPGLAAEPAGRLRRFLHATDRVKFAAFEPGRAEIEATYELALAFVEATAPRGEDGDATSPGAEGQTAIAAEADDRARDEEAA